MDRFLCFILIRLVVERRKENSNQSVEQSWIHLPLFLMFHRALHVAQTNKTTLLKYKWSFSRPHSCTPRFSAGQFYELSSKASFHSRFNIRGGPFLLTKGVNNKLRRGKKDMISSFRFFASSSSSAPSYLSPLIENYRSRMLWVTYPKLSPSMTKGKIYWKAQNYSCVECYDLLFQVETDELVQIENKENPHDLHYMDIESQEDGLLFIYPPSFLSSPTADESSTVALGEETKEEEEEQEKSKAREGKQVIQKKEEQEMMKRKQGLILVGAPLGIILEEVGDQEKENPNTDILSIVNSNTRERDLKNMKKYISLSKNDLIDAFEQVIVKGSISPKETIIKNNKGKTYSEEEQIFFRHLFTPPLHNFYDEPELVKLRQIQDVRIAMWQAYS